jgi:hypothetical protein
MMCEEAKQTTSVEREFDDAVRLEQTAAGPRVPSRDVDAVEQALRGGFSSSSE